MKYILSEKYNTKELQSKIMGPNPVKLAEELLSDCKINKNAVVCDLGSRTRSYICIYCEGVRF